MCLDERKNKAGAQLVCWSGCWQWDTPLNKRRFGLGSQPQTLSFQVQPNRKQSIKCCFPRKPSWDPPPPPQIYRTQIEQSGSVLLAVWLYPKEVLRNQMNNSDSFNNSCKSDSQVYQLYEYFHSKWGDQCTSKATFLLRESLGHNETTFLLGQN